jgi:integrase
MALTESQIATLKADGRTRRLYDGRGLFLEAHANGSRYWRLKYYSRLKRRTTKSLGQWPAVSLREARRLAASFREEREEKARGGATVRALADEWHASRKGKLCPKEHARQRFLLDRYILPALGALAPGEVTPRIVMDEVLRPVAARGKLETARRVRGVLSLVFRTAMALGEAASDPTAPLAGMLGAPRVRHRPAITDPAEVGGLLDAIASYSGTAAVEAALMMLPYVFTRPGELRNAEWAEFDIPGAMWRIPGGKMKMGTPHLVPLSRQVLGILEALRPATGGGRLLFPGSRAKGKPISDNTLNAALRYLGYPGDRMCAHGFRGMASTLLNQNGYNRDWIERQLAHQERSSVRAAYNHADWLPERARMMQEWADYLDGLREGYRQSRGL